MPDPGYRQDARAGPGGADGCEGRRRGGRGRAQLGTPRGGRLLAQGKVADQPVLASCRPVMTARVAGSQPELVSKPDFETLLSPVRLPVPPRPRGIFQ